MELSTVSNGAVLQLDTKPYGLGYLCDKWCNLSRSRYRNRPDWKQLVAPLPELWEKNQ